MIIWPENWQWRSRALWKRGAGLSAEKVNVMRSRTKKDDGGLPEMESVSKRSNPVGTDWPDNVSTGRSVARTWLARLARNCSLIGVNAAGSNATIITLG